MEHWRQVSDKFGKQGSGGIRMVAGSGSVRRCLDGSSVVVAFSGI